MRATLSVGWRSRHPGQDSQIGKSDEPIRRIVDRAARGQAWGLFSPPILVHLPEVQVDAAGRTGGQQALRGQNTAECWAHASGARHLAVARYRFLRGSVAE